MPELPEVETVRQTLRNLVLGHRIEEVVVLWPNIIEGEMVHFCESLKGQTIREIDRCGKYLVFLLDDVAFISHLRMEGKYLYESFETPLEKHTHVIFHLDHGMDLRYHDVRKFGKMSLSDKFDYRQKPPLAQMGPEPFDLTAQALQIVFKNSKQPIKTALLDQKKISGLGNIYANEVLFRAKIHPLSPAGDIPLKTLERLLEAACEVLNEAISQGGTTIRSFSSNGIHGLFAQKLDVYHRAGEKCPCCNHLIEQMKINTRSSYYCPHCQKMIKRRRKKK